MSMSAQVPRRLKSEIPRPKRKIQWISYGYMSPLLITLCVLTLAPIAYTIYISFTDFNQLHFLQFHFVGLKNYATLLNPNSPLSTVFIPTLIWTIVYAGLTTLFCYFIGLLLAMLLNNPNMKESVLYRVLLILPWVIPSVVTMLSWNGLLNDGYGQVNAFLQVFGLPRIPWQSSIFWARFSMIMVNVWAGFPYMMTVCLGALQAVPTELYEAAEMDGARWRQKFRFITLPGVWKVSLPLLIPSFAFNFNNFNAAYLLTGGGPVRDNNQFVGYTDILASEIYKMGLTYNRYDLASAMSVLLFILVAFISWLNMRYTGAFKGGEEA